MDRIGRVVSPVIGGCRIALGVVVLSLVAAVIIAPKDPSVPNRTEAIEMSRCTDTHILRVPEGALTGRLTVVDESGCPLATLTRWPNGSLAVTARRGGPGVGLWLNENDGTAEASVTGTPEHANVRSYIDRMERRIRAW